jgi:hypothetical protein
MEGLQVLGRFGSGVLDDDFDEGWIWPTPPHDFLWLHDIELHWDFMMGHSWHHYRVQIFIRDHIVPYAAILKTLSTLTYVFESPGSLCRGALLIASMSLFLTPVLVPVVRGS